MESQKLEELARNFAENLNNLILGLAQKIDELETENAGLKSKLAVKEGVENE